MKTKLKDSDPFIISACNGVVSRAAALMHDEVGASVEMIIDRLLTYALAQATAAAGTEATANMLRMTADNIENGLFENVASNGGTKH